MGSTDRQRYLLAITVLLLAGLAGCATQSSDPTTTAAQPPDVGSTTTTTATATTAPATPTTTAPVTTTTISLPTTTTTTSAPTTTTATLADSPPGVVSGLTVSMGGGSGEVIPEWDRGSEPDLDHYNVWYSLTPGSSKTLLVSVNHDPDNLPPPAYDAGGGRTAYVDYPRSQMEGTECYQISAVDIGGNEGARTPEVCLPATPPGAVSEFTVGLGGGSGEVFLTWIRGPELDLDHYELWYSELPGQPKSLLGAVAHSPGSLAAPAYDAGGGITAYVDYPRELANGKQCYQISAVDVAGNAGPLAPEQCLSGL